MLIVLFKSKTSTLLEQLSKSLPKNKNVRFIIYETASNQKQTDIRCSGPSAESAHVIEFPSQVGPNKCFIPQIDHASFWHSLPRTAPGECVLVLHDSCILEKYDETLIDYLCANFDNVKDPENRCVLHVPLSTSKIDRPITNAPDFIVARLASKDPSAMFCFQE